MWRISKVARYDLYEPLFSAECGVLAIDIMRSALFHLHTIWELPRDDSDYATRWRQIKTLVSRSFAAQFPGRYCSISASRCRRDEKGIWQRRFFEHTCRDENDVKRLLDYIHVNPVKHKLVSQVRDWAWSSFHRYVKLGEYPPDWGGGDAWYGDEFSRLE